MLRVYADNLAIGNAHAGVKGSGRGNTAPAAPSCWATTRRPGGRYASSRWRLPAFARPRLTM